MSGNHLNMKTYTIYFFATAIVYLTPVSALWAQECNTEALNQRFPSAQSAINQWSVQNNVGVGIETTTLVINDFCQAANTIQMKKDVPDIAIDKVASQVIFEYLDGENDSSIESVSSVGAILRSVLGASGLAPQRLKRMATLDVSYTADHKDIDYLKFVAYGEFTGSQMAPLKRIMKRPGRYVVKGIKGQSVVCSFEVELVVNHPEERKC